MIASPWVRAGRMVLAPLGWLFERLGNRFYVGLALGLAIFFIWAIVGGLMRGMQNQAYDLILKNRFHVAAPHPDVVLIDIDEASLAAMAPEYGRWPWPRSVMAEFIERMAPGHPQAIVFDITFVDPDLNYRDADAYLWEVASNTPNTFFTMIRLNPDNDHLSELKLSALAGVHPVDGSVTPNDTPDATVAMIVPYFFAALSGHRLGTNNVYPGSDGITRRYDLYRDVAGFRIGSLPANVVTALGRAIPATPQILINWRGEPGAYPTYSFHPLFQRLVGADGAAAAAMFRDKILVIGSTAPSLFDLKATPMSQNHPGLEILATVIDNLYTGDSLRQLPQWIVALITVLMLVLLATAFVYNVDYRLLNPAFTVVQAGFLTISFLFLNYSTLFVDLSAPFAAGMIYFFIARLYSMGLNWRRNGHPLFSAVLDPGNRGQVLLLRCGLPGNKTQARRVRSLLLRRVGLTTYGVSAPRIFKQSPLLAALYHDTLLVYWLVPFGRTRYALADLIGMLDSTIAILDARAETCEFGLDAFELSFDTTGDWRMAGKTALTRALATGRGAKAVTRVEATAEFREIGGSAVGDVPQRLQQAGLVL